MAIVTLGYEKEKHYKIVCTDLSCRAILEFSYTDVKCIQRYGMGRELDSVQGIVCPHCGQILKLEEAEEI